MNIDAKRNQAGFNLVELMVVLLVVSVISALGGPALGDTVKRNRLRTEADRIITTLNLTRSEAVKRNQAVSICRSSDGATCTGDWADGWIVFTNVDGDNTVDAGVDEVIRVYSGLKTGYTLSGTISSDSLTYFSDGSYAGGSGAINICAPDIAASESWSVLLNTVGRPRTKLGVSSCS
jgi:type IV fimbrial biogenesis protein FimT